MKCFLGISNFLEEISSLSHSVVFPYFFALMAEELSFLKNFYCNRVDLQCCVSFCCTAKSISYIYPLFLRFFSHIGHKSILTIVPCAISVQFSSVQSLSHVRLFATPWTVARRASLSSTNSWSPPKQKSIESVIPSNHLILCRPLLPSIFPSIRVFSNEKALRIRWLNY